MALTTLRYLQDDDDPLNDLLGGGGEPSVPDAPPQPAQQDSPPQQDPSLEQSLLDQNQPPPAAAAPERVYSEPDPVKLRDSYAQPGAAIGGAPKDPELDAAYRNAQMDALQHGGFDDNKYGVGEAVRDNGAALIASILDIGFNKGRGLGGIVGAASNEVGKQEAAREAQRKDARDFALKAREKGDSALQQQRLQYLMDSLAEREKAHGDVNDRFAKGQAARLPDSPIYQADIQKTGLKAAAGATGRLNAEHALVDQTAGDKATLAGSEQDARAGVTHDWAPVVTQDSADRAAAEQGARIQTDLAFTPQTNAAAASKAGAVANAQIAPELAKQQGMNPILADRANNGVGQGLSAEGIARANPGLDIADPQLLQQAMKTRQVNQKTLDDIKAANRGGEIVQRLHDTAETYQALITNDPAAIASPQAAELRRQYKAHAEEYAGVIGRVSGNNSLTSHKEAMDLVPDLHNPYATDGIKGLWSPLEANINGNLGAIGIRAKPPAFLAGGQTQPGAAAPGAPPPAAAAPQQSQAMPGYSTDYSDPRSSLGAPQALPQKPAGANHAPPPAAGVHHIRNPRTGKVVPTMMDPERLKPALAAGWQVVD